MRKNAVEWFLVVDLGKFTFEPVVFWEQLASHIVKVFGRGREIVYIANSHEMPYHQDDLVGQIR